MSALTLAEMRVAQWELIAGCGKCGLQLRVSLQAMIKVHGPDEIWWGRKPACPNLDCSKGQLLYRARSIPGGSWVVMNQPPEARLVEVWKAKNRARGEPR